MTEVVPKKNIKRPSKSERSFIRRQKAAARKEVLVPIKK